MKRAGGLCFVLILLVSITAGCWNLKEPDQLAFVSGTGLDFTKDGQLQISIQVVNPSGIGGGQDNGGATKKKSFRVISAAGRNVYDTVPNLQAQLSRSLFLGHREIILIGQHMAEQGIDNLLDAFVRNQRSEFRSRIFVVKEGQARDILSVEPILEQFISTVLLREQASLGLKEYYFRDFLSDALSPGLQPMVAAFSLSPIKQYVYAGNAIFNKDDGLKLMGFLNINESFLANWIANRQTGFTMTSFVKRGNGNVSVNLQSLSRRIRVKIVDKHIQIDVLLTGKGTIVENNSNLDPTKRKDLYIIQDELSQTTQKSIQQLIVKVQKQYKTDIFGFGERVHQQYPKQWQTLKRTWNDTFPELPVSVKVDLQGIDSGKANSSVKSIP